MNPSEKKRYLEVFKEEARFWINELGLKEWNYSFILRECRSDNIAEVAYNNEAKNAVLSLNTRWLDGKMENVVYEVTYERTRQTAFHEIFEVMLADIEDVITEDPKNVTRINTERHRIIRRMENILFPLKGKIIQSQKR